MCNRIIVKINKIRIISDSSIAICEKCSYTNLVMNITYQKENEMEQKYRRTIDALKNRKIRLSHQRMKILEYMCHNRNHPTADQIYNALHEEEPTLSKTTVYNTLHMLCERELIREINIETSETRYDIAMEDHGHFKCTECGAVYDFCFDFEDIAAKELSGFEVMDKNVYFKGICPRCLHEKGKTGKK